MRFSTNPDQPPARPSRFGLFLFLVLIYAGFKVFSGLHLRPFHLPETGAPPPLPVIPIAATGDAAAFSPRLHLGGHPVWGNGAGIDLGDRRTRLPGALLSRFFPDPFLLASCLTELPPAAPPPQKRLPVRDDWPGFYGAPWLAWANGNLIVLLNVYAPRHSGLVPPPQFEIYPGYTGAAPAPALSISAPAELYRGSKAVLYRVFLNAKNPAIPLRCLDLTVQNGENNGIGRLYYQKYHHYYEADTSFVIRP